MHGLCENPKGKVIADLGAETTEGDFISKPLRGSNDVKLLGKEHGDDFEQGVNLEDNSCDIVIAGEILEHLTKPTFFMSEIVRILKPKGILIMSVPNTSSLKNRIRCLLGKSIMNGAYADYSDDCHYSNWNMDLICELAKKSGLRVIYKGSRFWECCIFKAVKK